VPTSTERLSAPAQPTAAVTFPAIAGQTSAGGITSVDAWAIVNASSGGTLLYAQSYGASWPFNTAMTIPASVFRVAAESI
jgi:hypothetical protein